MKRQNENEATIASDSPAPRNRSRSTSNASDPSRTDETRTGSDVERHRAKTERRQFLQLLGTGSVLFVAGCSSVTGKASKEQVNYRDQPNGKQQCSNCQYYSPPEDGEDAGTCSRVAGDIEPDDWCGVYSRG